MRNLGVIGILASLCGAFILAMPLGIGWAQEEGVTDTTVKIGSINDTTGGLAAYGNTRVEAHKALINHINDQGGINGRKVIYINESDNYEPTKTVLAFKKLMEVDKIFCMASVLGVTNTMAIAPEVQSRKVPYLMIGGNSSKLFFPPQRYIFGIWPTYEHFQQIILDFIADELKMPNAKIAHIHQETESGRDSVRGMDAYLPKYPGMKLVARESFKYGTLDYSATVFKAKEAKPDVVVMSTILTQSAAITKEMEKIGWKPIVVMDAANPDPKLPALGGTSVEGAYIQANFPMMDHDVPGVLLMKEVIKKYFPDSKINPSPYGLSGFIEMQLALEGVKRAGRNLTREGLIEAMHNAFKGVDIGSVPPVTYGPDKHWGSNQSYFLQVKGGKLLKVTGWRAPKYPMEK